LPETDEWISPLPHSVSLVTHVRGSLLSASRDQLRVAGRYEDYERHLTPQARGDLANALVTAWVPVSLAHEHFGAIDRLGLSDGDVGAMTEEVSKRLNGPFMQTMSSTLRTSGITPWDIFPFYDKVWRRLFVGGALGVAKIGPKDARVLIAGHTLLRHRYHRIGLARHMASGVRFLANKAATYVSEQRLDGAAGRCEFVLQWV
jgi:hypothetical protein